MPRKKKSAPKKEAAEKPTYLKSKNGRYYKKTKLPSGKCQCRFVSKAEAEAGGFGSLESKKESKKVKKKEESS